MEDQADLLPLYEQVRRSILAGIESGQFAEGSFLPAEPELMSLYGVSRITLALVWIYQGIVPKLLFRDTGELEILRESRAFPGREADVLTFVGLSEIGLGLALLVLFRSTRLVWVVIGALAVLLAGAAVSRPALLAAPFNPVALTLALTRDSSTLALTLAWLYVVLRVGHSLWQAMLNVIEVRFYLFAASSVVLLLLTLKAAARVF